MILKLIVAGNLTDDLQKELKSEGFELVFTCKNTNLLPGLQYHPDMQIAKINDKFICDKSVYSYYRQALGDDGFRLICGKTQCRSNYPEDVAYNIKVIQNSIIHNFKYTDEVVKEHSSALKHIDVTQGYTGCSICSVADRGIITADRVIAQRADSAGVDSLLISPCHIDLPGFDFGFIGGGSFFYHNTLYFFGDISLHPDYKDIYAFCEKHGVFIKNLSNNMVCDYGSAITVD